MSPFAALSLGALVVNGVLAAYLVWRNPRSSTARIYVLLLGAFLVWDVPELLLRMDLGWEPDRLLLLVKIEWTGIALIPGLMAHFVLDYPRRHPLLERPWALLALYTPSIIFATFLWGGELLVAGVAVGALGPDARLGAAYPFLAFLYAAIIFVALVHLGRGYRSETGSRARARYALLFAGFSVPVLGGMVTEIYGPYLFALPTRLGLGTAYTTVFTAFVAYAVYRYGLLVIEPAREAAGARAFAWEKGLNYLVTEPSRTEAFQAFRSLVQEVPGLCVTAFPPSILRAEFDLPRVPFLWLTGQEGHPWTLKPTYLEVDVLQTLLKFMRDHPGAAILWDDLEYLAQVNGVPALLRTVGHAVAAASKHGCTLLAALHPQGLEGPAAATLTGFFDRVEAFEGRGASPRPTLVPPGCFLWEGSREACFEALSRAALARKTVTTTLYPEKLRSAYDLHDAGFLWVTKAPDPGVPSYHPARLTLEVRRDVSRQAVPGSLLYLGELEVLVQEAGFLEVLEYVKQVVDVAVDREGVVVASVQGDALPGWALATLERRFAAIVR